MSDEWLGNMLHHRKAIPVSDKKTDAALLRLDNEVSRLREINAELLDALQEARTFMLHEGAEYLSNPMPLINAAIAKASEP